MSDDRDVERSEPGALLLLERTVVAEELEPADLDHALAHEGAHHRCAAVNASTARTSWTRKREAPRSRRARDGGHRRRRGR